MSRIGKMPVTIPENVEVKLDGTTLIVKGPKGELKLNFESMYVDIKIENKEIIVTRKNETKEARSRHGLYRSLAQNLIQGVTEGFSKTLEINGVGYNGKLQGTDLVLNLGYSHPINYKIPEGVKITFAEKSQTVLTISGINKQLVGQVAAEIREFRKPEPYKGKGIKYSDEHIARKVGKSIAKKE